MPYLPGNQLVDASNNALIDLSNIRLGEPPFDLGQLVADVRALAEDILLSFGPFSTLGGGLRTIVQDLLGTTPARAMSTMDYVEALYTILDPTNLTGGRIPATLEANQTALLAAITAVRQDAAGPHLPTIEDVLGVIGAGPGVDLPAVPPTGYGGATVAEVWGHYLNGIAGGGVTADEGLSQTWIHREHHALYSGFPVNHQRDFVVNEFWPYGATHATDFAGITCDYSDIHADDTVLSWLTRTDTSGRVWALDAATGLCTTETNLTGEYLASITCTLRDADLQAIRAGYGNTALPANNVAPIWPGIDGVTLGTTLPCVLALTFEGPCDGILISILGTPLTIQQMNIGSDKLYRGIGRLAFRNDNGQLEPWQPVAANECIMVPKTMSHSSGFVMGFYNTQEAAVTPWTLNV